VIVAGGEFHIHFGLLALGGFVLDAEIRERDFAVDYGEAVVFSDLSALVFAFGFGQRIELGEPRIDGLLKLEIEDDALHAAALVGDSRRYFPVEPVNGGVVPELAGLDELGVVDLAAARGPAEVKDGVAVARESRVDGLGGVHRAHPEKAMAQEITDFCVGLGAIAPVAVSGEIVESERAERANVGEGLKLGIAESVARLGSAAG